MNKEIYSFKNKLKFIIPSLIGVLLFMIPVKSGEEITIPIAIASKKLLNLLSSGSLDNLPLYIITILVCISALGSIIFRFIKPKFMTANTFLSKLFDVSIVWFVGRVLGAIFCIMTLFEVGPEIIWSEITGGFVLSELLTILFSIFFFAGLFLPLLLDFGLLEFFGTMLTKVMRPIFTLPGRSSIDCITSWLGDGTLGIMLTSKQYEEGFYNKREATVIATTFSAVSITFSLIVIDTVGLAHMFIPFYLTVSLAGIVAAIIIPRIPPLSRKSNAYIDGSTTQKSESIPEGYNIVSYGYEQALLKAETNKSFKKFFIDGIENVFDMWLGVIPIVMTMATLALIIAEYTSIFQWLGLPFVPLLKLLQVPEAVEASRTLVVGFADMLLPAALAAKSVTNEMTRFIIACTSVTQLIYMSEVGGVLLGSKIPVSIKDLLIIFILRTVITLPVIVLIANLLF